MKDRILIRTENVFDSYLLTHERSDSSAVSLNLMVDVNLVTSLMKNTNTISDLVLTLSHKRVLRCGCESILKMFWLDRFAIEERTLTEKVTSCGMSLNI